MECLPLPALLFLKLRDGSSVRPKDIPDSGKILAHAVANETIAELLDGLHGIASRQTMSPPIGNLVANLLLAAEAGGIQKKEIEESRQETFGVAGALAQRGNANVF